jgi:Ni,Fe-hydrogenase I cytochrome b subunit
MQQSTQSKRLHCSWCEEVHATFIYFFISLCFIHIYLFLFTDMAGRRCLLTSKSTSTCLRHWEEQVTAPIWARRTNPQPGPA